MRKHYDCQNNCNLVLPPTQQSMTFFNFENMLERPFIVYCDFECSLIKTEMSDKIARHEPNSAAAYFVCTFDSSRNKYYKFDGRDCVLNLIDKLRLLATKCVEEQRKNERMILTEEDENNFKKATSCSICSEPFADWKDKVETTATERENTEEQRTIAAILITSQIVFCRLFSTSYEATTAT